MDLNDQLADDRTLDALDFASVRERVIGATRTQRGRARAAELLPSLDFAGVRIEQQRTSAVRQLVASADLHVLPAVDTAGLTQAASVGRTLGSTDLRAVADAISAAAAAYNALREEKQEALAAITATYTPLRDLQRSLVDAIDERGTVMDRASPALARIRKSLVHAQNDARDRVSTMVRSSKYANAIQDAVVTIRDGRYVIPIKAEFSGEFPGIVHDTSSSGQTLFVEPLAALETNNRVRTLRLDEEREVQRVLEELSRAVGAQADAVERNVDMLAAIDLLVAKAQVARAMDAIEPELSDEAIAHIERGRHPLLADRAVPQTHSARRRHAAARDQRAEHGRQNRGAQAGRLVRVHDLLRHADSGFHRHANRAVHLRRRRYRRRAVYCGQRVDVFGAFAAHARNATTAPTRIRSSSSMKSAAARNRRPARLSPSPCSSVCWNCVPAASSRRMRRNSSSSRHATPAVANASVRFDPQSFRPTYQLDVGAPGQSLAFPLANALGIPHEIVDRAQALLDTRERDYESALNELSLRAAEMQTEREALTRERRAAEGERESLREQRERLDVERRSFADRAEERMQQGLREFTHELQRRAAANAARPRVTNAQSELLSKTLQEMRRDLGIKRSRGRNARRGRRSAAGRSRPHNFFAARRYGGRRLRRYGPSRNRTDEDGRKES